MLRAEHHRSGGRLTSLTPPGVGDSCSVQCSICCHETKRSARLKGWCPRARTEAGGVGCARLCSVRRNLPAARRPSSGGFHRTQAVDGEVGRCVEGVWTGLEIGLPQAAFPFFFAYIAHRALCTVAILLRAGSQHCPRRASRCFGEGDNFPFFHFGPSRTPRACRAVAILCRVVVLRPPSATKCDPETLELRRQPVAFFTSCLCSEARWDMQRDCMRRPFLIAADCKHPAFRKFFVLSGSARGSAFIPISFRPRKKGHTVMCPFLLMHIIVATSRGWRQSRLARV